MLRRLAGRRVTLAAVLAMMIAATIGIVGVDADTAKSPPAAGSPTAACGVNSTSTLTAVDTKTASLIYADELDGTETREDIGRVTSSSALLSGLAEDNRTAVQNAVSGLVYAPGWHIVRLRVIRAGHVLADVGGPYVVAPVTGPLRWHGKIVGRYVMSVQDDAGYVKLVTRFIGIPLEIYRNGLPLMGTLNAAPRTVTNGAPVAGHRYQARVLNLKAFPTGSLRVALMVPTPGAPVEKQACAAIRLAAWGSVVKHVAARLNPLPAHYSDLVSVLRATTGFRAYVTVGSRRVAGERLPRKLPASGAVHLAGHTWQVFSWSPASGVRVYLLTSP